MKGLFTTKMFTAMARCAEELTVITWHCKEGESMRAKQVLVMWTAAVLFALATYQPAMAQLSAQPRMSNPDRLLQQIERNAMQAEQGCQQGNQPSCWMAQG